MPQDQKAVLRRHWNKRTMEFHSSPNQMSGAPAERAEWRRLFVLPVGAILAGFLLFMPESSASAAEERVITDMRGREIRLPAVVDRAVGTGGAVDEWFLLLGAADKLVATAPAIQANPWFSRFYPRIRRIAAPISSGDVNIEALLAERPQVAILLSGMTSIEKIEHAGIATVVLDRSNASELKRAVAIAGRVLGPLEEERAGRFSAYYDANVARVTARTAGLPPERRVRVYYAGASALTTEGAATMVEAWIATAGGRNMAAEAGLQGMGAQVTPEDLLTWDPEVIVTMTPAARDEILASPRWKSVTAVRSGRVFVNPKGVYSWGIRSAEEAIQVLWAAKVIHPELFADIDMTAETKRFHKLFYGVELSDADAKHMLAAEPPD